MGAPLFLGPVLDTIRANIGAADAVRAPTIGPRFGTPFRGVASGESDFLKGFSKLRSLNALPPHLQGFRDADILNAFRGNPSDFPTDIIPRPVDRDAAAQAAREQFLAQTPLGDRLRRGLRANFRGQNLFGGEGSLLGGALRRGIPGVGPITVQPTPPPVTPPVPTPPPVVDPAQAARNAFLAQTPEGADLRQRLGRSFRSFAPPPPPPAPAPCNPINPTFGSAQEARDAFLGQNPLGERLRRGLRANFQGQNLFGGGQSRLGQAFRSVEPTAQLQIPNVPVSRSDFLAQNPLGDRLRRGLRANFQGQNLFGDEQSRLGQAFLGRLGGRPSRAALEPFASAPFNPFPGQPLPTRQSAGIGTDFGFGF